MDPTVTAIITPDEAAVRALEAAENARHAAEQAEAYADQARLLAEHVLSDGIPLGWRRQLVHSIFADLAHVGLDGAGAGRLRSSPRR